MLKFKVMFMDEVVAYIELGKNELIRVETYTNIAYKQPFLKKPVTFEYVKGFLEKRVVSPDKSNINEVLAQLGLKEYNIIEILKKTHGTNFDDFLWVKFDNSNTTWDEVRLR